MDSRDLIEAESWERVVSCLPAGCEEAARERGALMRRREIRSAADLLRLSMAYSTCDLPLRATACWAALQGLGDMSSVAVLKRLKRAAAWLGWLLWRLLAEDVEFGKATSRPVRILDASVVSEPGARETNWRVHLGLDLACETIRSVELTGPEGGETFRRHTVEPGEILLADCGYAHPAGVAHVLSRGGHVVVRLNWQNFPLEDSEGRKIDLLGLLESLSVEEIGDWDVWFGHRGPRYQVRLVALRKTAEPTEQGAQRIQKRARKKQRCADPRTVRASCFIFVLTDLPREELPDDQVLDLYRLRWRVEMAFKRFKSVLDLDALRAHDPQLIRTYLYTKLVTAILLERLDPQNEADRESLADEPGSFPPCGEAAATPGAAA
jgi:hypothetical protein